MDVSTIFQKPSRVYRPNDKTVISSKTLESIQNHLMRNNPDEYTVAEQESEQISGESPKISEINVEPTDSGEVVDLDCEVEILSTDNEGELKNSRLMNKKI